MYIYIHTYILYTVCSSLAMQCQHKAITSVALLLVVLAILLCRLCIFFEEASQAIQRCLQGRLALQSGMYGLQLLLALRPLLS